MSAEMPLTARAFTATTYNEERGRQMQARSDTEGLERVMQHYCINIK